MATPTSPNQNEKVECMDFVIEKEKVFWVNGYRLVVQKGYIRINTYADTADIIDEAYVDIIRLIYEVPGKWEYAIVKLTKKGRPPALRDFLKDLGLDKEEIKKVMNVVREFKNEL